MSGSRWVIIPLWLSGSWRSFCIVLLCILATSYKYLLLLLCPYHFCPLLGPSLNEMFSFISLIFLKRSLVFPFYCFPLFLCIDHWGRLSYLPLLFFGTASKWVYLSFSHLPFVSLLFTAICKASSDSHFAFLCFFFLGMVLITASCIMSWTSIHSSSGTLSDLIPWIYLSLPLYNHKVIPDLGMI